MPHERRLSHYRQVDVWLQLVHYASHLDITLVEDSATASSVSLIRQGKTYRAAVLARSSDWYEHSLNVPQWLHGCTAAIAGTHDSCLPIPCAALDTLHWYEPLKMRDIFGPLQPMYGPDGKALPDKFDKARRTHYGHAMLVGGLMCGRQDAIARLQSLPERTRFRIEAELRRLHHRRRGRPLKLGPSPSEDAGIA